MAFRVAGNEKIDLAYIYWKANINEWHLVLPR